MKKGFTLIELLVVIAIIGVFAGIILSTSIDKAEEKTLTSCWEQRQQCWQQCLAREEKCKDDLK